MKDFILDALESIHLKKVVLSNSNDKKNFERATLRPLVIKGKRILQISEQRNSQIFHKNVSAKEGLEYIDNHLQAIFREAHFFIKDEDHHIWVKKDGTLIHKVVKTALPKEELSHNRKKNYLLQEGVPYPFFVSLNVMDSKGRVFPEKRDKFRQVNRFLEIASGALSHLYPQKLKIVDLGCGKAYLTFALHYYLKEIVGIEVEVIGVDLKKDVICSLNEISDSSSLIFRSESIDSFHVQEPVDVVIALHACDLATDCAIAKAVSMQAKVILVAPCCQHELYTQIESPLLAPLLKHGILKERFSALATDACRASLLNLMGYKTQIVEFVDPQHTPKNILIKAVKTKLVKNKESQILEYLAFKNALKIFPSLERLLNFTE